MLPFPLLFSRSLPVALFLQPRPVSRSEQKHEGGKNDNRSPATPWRHRHGNCFRRVRHGLTRQRGVIAYRGQTVKFSE